MKQTFYNSRITEASLVAFVSVELGHVQVCSNHRFLIMAECLRYASAIWAEDRRKASAMHDLHTQRC